MRSRIRFDAARFAASAAVVLGLGTAMAADLQVSVWDDQAGVLLNADVSATGLLGAEKGTLLGSVYSFENAGIVTPEGNMKTSLVVSDPVWGDAYLDLLFESTSALSVDVVFTGPNTAEALSGDLIFVDSGSGDGGQSNDDCANAIAVASPSVTSGSTAGATDDFPPFCVTAVTAPGVWYSVEGTGTTMTVGTCNFNFDYDTKINVYCGSCDDLTCVTGNDDNCPDGASGLLSSVEFCSQAGATYYILVQGFGGQTGSFDLAVSANASPCDATIECIPPVAVGACCFSNGQCFLLTEEECTAQGGLYQGDLTDCFGSGDATDFTSNPNAAIPDNNPVGISDTITVGPNDLIADVNVTIDIPHTWQGDLIVSLQGPGGETAELINRIGEPAIGAFGCAEDNFAGTTIDDQGTGGDIEDVCQPNNTSPPNFVGNESLNAAFGGTFSQGDWTLTVSDNAAGDTGTLVSWTLSIAGASDGICEQECFMVVGDGSGSSTFNGGFHTFETQVGPVVEDSYPVLMTSIPEFVLPTVKPATRGNNGLNGAMGFGGGNVTPFVGADSPEWMLDGEFAVQVMMWNPGVFPNLPEQFSVGLDVTLLPNGRVVTTQFGDAVGEISFWSEIDVNEDGQTVVRFPFTINGL